MLLLARLLARSSISLHKVSQASPIKLIIPTAITQARTRQQGLGTHVKWSKESEHLQRQYSAATQESQHTHTKGVLTPITTSMSNLLLSPLSFKTRQPSR